MQPTYVAVSIAAIACVTDLRSQRIPNALTFSAAVAALAWHALTGGTTGVIASAAGLLFGIALFLPFFALRGLGAGDVKLLGALGAWLGPAAVLPVALFAAMAGGVLALVIALSRGYARRAFRNVGFMLRFWTTVGMRPVEGLTLGDNQAPKLAYAVPVMAGLLVTLWLR